MDKKTKDELVIFISAIAVIAVTFTAGIIYLRTGNKSNAATLATTTTITPVITTTTTAVVTVTSSTPTTTIPKATTTIIAIATSVVETSSAATITVPPLIKPNSTSTPSSPTPLTLPYSIGTFSNGFADGDGWTTNWWGSTSQSNGVMTIGANSSTTGGEALLPGSDAWTDYTFQAIVDWHIGQTFGLIARYVNENNYVVCEFNQPEVGTVLVSLDQYIKGKRIDLADGTVQNYNEMGGVGISAIIQVDGNQGECGFNYHSISTLVAGHTLAPPNAGGIGITTWDPTRNNSEIVVRSVGVTTQQYDLGPDTIQGNYNAASQY